MPPSSDETRIYSPQHVPYSIPPAGDPRVHGFCLEAISEGERILRADPNYSKADEMIAHISGQVEDRRPSYLQNVQVNQSKRAARAHVSTLTDLRPLFAWQTKNPRFKDQADILNQYLVAWWVNTFADLHLADAIRYSLAIGSGDLVIEYDPNYMGVGDTRMLARDPRDLLPIRPERDPTIQSWEGCVIREGHSPERMLSFFPDKPGHCRPTSGKLGGIFTRYRRFSDVAGAAMVPTTLSGLGDKDPSRPGAPSSILATPECILHRLYIKDRTRNLTEKPVTMGDPLSNWAYVVLPGDPLYPRGRLILFTEYGVLSDGPNPCWHGYFPASRLRLDPWPWSFLGSALLSDLMPLQNALSRTVNDFLQVFSQWVNRGSVWDSRMPEPLFQRFDPRVPNWKVKRPTQFTEGFKLQDGPQLPPWSMQFLDRLFTKFDELSGTANLQALLQLRQSPGKETLETYLNAMTPDIRLEGRQVELCLRDVAHMLKGNVFQFVSKARRVMILGDAGVTFEDFDYDPQTMVPSMSPTEEAYLAELDKDLPRDVRAQYFMTLFSFFVAPNSLLAMNAQERKLTYLQMARQGYIDVWTLAEVMEIPNYGEAPPVPLPPRNMEGIDPMQPPPLELRMPQTITERLIAQQAMGIGQTVSPVGRKASGQQAPQILQRQDGSTTVSESGS